MLGLGGGNIGAHILPAKRDKAGHCISAGPRRLQNI